MTAATGRSILGRYSVLLCANLATAGIGFATASLVARQFGTTGLGSVSLAGSITTYALLATTCGTDMHAVREVASRRHPLGRMVASVMAVRAALAVPAYAAVLVVTATVPQFREIGWLVAAFGLSVFTTAADVSWVPQAVHRTHVAAVSSLAVQAIAFASLAISLLVSPTIYAAPASRVAAEAAVALGLIVWVRRSAGAVGRPYALPGLVSLVRQSAPIGASQLMRGVALGSDMVVLALLLPKHDVGVYSAAFRVFMLFLGLATAYFTILLPRIAERSGDSEGTSRELRSSLRLVLPPMCAGLAVVALAAAPLLRLLFGPEFDEAAASLRILLLAVVANVVLRHYRQVLLSRHLQVADLRQSVVAALVHVVSKALLIPVLGISGCAVGTLVGESALLVMQRVTAHRALGAAPEARS